jgi:dipeptidyl aminopeptidase/acylaminoacyl peptidase
MTLTNIYDKPNLKFPLLFLLIIFLLNNSYGQNLKKMTPEVYSQWNKVKNVQMSDSCELIVYSLEKEVGDKKLAIYKKATDQTYFFNRVRKYNTDPSGQYVVFLKGLSYDSLRTLQRKKTSKDKLPKDSLSIFNAMNQSIITIEEIEDFKMPDKYSGYLFYTKKLKISTPKINDSLSIDTTELVKIVDNKEKTKKSPCETKALIIRKLDTGTEDTIRNVKDYVFAKDFPKLAYCQCSGDSIAMYNVNIMDLNNGLNKVIKTDLTEATQMSFDNKGIHFAFLGLELKSDAKQKPYDVYINTESDTTAYSLTNKVNTIKPQDWVISSDKAISWSETGKRLFFGIAPIRPVRDTTLLDDEIVNVEIWHHDSPRLYTQQEASISNDSKKAFTIMYDLVDTTIMQLETLDADKSIISKKGEGRYVLQINAMPYQKEITWLGESRKDFLLLDTKTNESTLILTGEYGNPSFSPDGRYLYWWNSNDSIWKTFDTENRILGTLGLWSVTTFHNEENDIPQHASAYGIAGWLKDDAAAIVYDRYDLWKIDPTNPFNYEQWTNGREKKQVHRWINTDEEKDFIDTTEVLLLHRFDEKSKATAYVNLDTKSDSYTVLLNGDLLLTSNVKKASKSNDLIYTQESFEIFPDLKWTNDLFLTTKNISNANPQQSEYGWGKASLFSWTNYRNKQNDGMVFYPPNFDPEKKYPMIVNFYERSSNDFHRHRAPEAHRSTINYTYYTNNDYIIFNPDIKYLTGQPGDDCVNAVESGVDALVKTGYIDESRIALQGHSWGGYQVAYLLTKSERYKCAEAGAPVVNMVSAYGGVRWESGMSRMFQYEKTQSRLGVTLWEDPKAYHKNSPIYEMTNVTTPILIMHNDQDGAVPWYQSIEYYMALRRLNKPCWLLNYNDEPHWPVKWQNRLDFNIRMEQFFNHYLKDGPLPLWMKEGNTPLEKGILNKY